MTKEESARFDIAISTIDVASFMWQLSWIEFDNLSKKSFESDFSFEINLSWVEKLSRLIDFIFQEHGNSIHVDKTLIESRKRHSKHPSLELSRNGLENNISAHFHNLPPSICHDRDNCDRERNLSRVAAQEIENILTRIFTLRNAI